MVTGTGKDGRLTKADVMAFLKADDSSNVTPGDPATLVADSRAALRKDPREMNSEYR
jgi:hypothetical protein